MGNSQLGLKAQPSAISRLAHSHLAAVEFCGTPWAWWCCLPLAKNSCPPPATSKTGGAFEMDFKTLKYFNLQELCRCHSLLSINANQQATGRRDEPPRRAAATGITWKKNCLCCESHTCHDLFAAPDHSIHPRHCRICRSGQQYVCWNNGMVTGGTLRFKGHVPAFV